MKKTKKARSKKVVSNRRANNKYAALDVKFNLKSRQDLIDYDYIDKLSEEEKAWLNKFSEEYTNDKLNRKNLKKNLHNNKKLKKDCDDRNNARNRDIYTTTKASGKLVFFEDLAPTYPDQKTEDDIINELDESKKLIDDLDIE